MRRNHSYNKHLIGRWTSQLGWVFFIRRVVFWLAWRLANMLPTLKNTQLYWLVNRLIRYIYPMPWKIQPIRGQDCRCIFCGIYSTGNMQRVVFHSTFPSLLALNSLLGSIWGFLKSQLRNSSTPANHYEHFRSHPEIFRRFSNTFEDFRRFSENFKKS